MYAVYTNYIPEDKIKSKSELFKKYGNRSKTNNGVVAVGFSTDGYFVTQPNTLSEQYRLSAPIEVKINQVKKSEPDDFTRTGAALMIPLLVPSMMIGCTVGPC